MNNYTFTSLSQNFSFGKYKNSSLDEVLTTNPSYIEWCIENISDFCMTPDLIAEVKSKYPNVKIPGDFELRYMDQLVEDISDECDTDSDSDDYGSHYGEFAGSYAQDVMGYSDDVISDAFEGDPDCYWNID